MKQRFIIIFLCWLPHLQAQSTYTGTITDENGQFLPGASVQASPYSQYYTISDTSGVFLLELPDSIPPRVVVSFVGFVNDTVLLTPGKTIRITLSETRELKEAVINETGISSTISTNLVGTVEILNERELQKAACCNLSESFETNATVDVNYPDAITGAKNIQMLGLDGKYVQLTTELIPSIRGLAAPYGLGYIAGTWMESIQVSKGVSSVVYGYEGMTGQINLQLRPPEKTDRFFLNLYANHLGRLEGNIHVSHRFKKGWSTVTLLNGNYWKNLMDDNGDSFVEVPQLAQGSFVHKWSYFGKRTETQFGVKGLIEDRKAGNLAYFHNDSILPRYGVNLLTYRAEAFGKFGILFPGQPWKSIGIITNGSWHQQRGFYGNRNYNGEQWTGYVNIIYQSIIGNTRHQFKTGGSFLGDDITEAFGDTLLHRTELVPGGFFEYTYNNLKNLTLVAGVRADYHNLFGFFPSPRVHIRYEPVKGLEFRVSGGRGFRTANIFAENTGLMLSSRQFIIEGRLLPEVSWNYGTSVTYRFNIFKRRAIISADFFRTDFTNQIIADREAADRVVFYNLDGSSYSNVAQLHFEFEPLKFWSVRLGYKYQDVKTTFKDDGFKRQPLVPEHKLLGNMAFNIRKIGLDIDFTVSVNGPSRLPAVIDPETGQPIPAASPWFALLNAQMTKKFKWLDVYLGGENINGYVQEKPVLGAAQPFGSGFDATIVYAPIMGRVFYVGLRFHLDYQEKKK